MAKQADTLQAMRDEFGFYYLSLNPDYAYVRYQQEDIVPLLEMVERGEVRRLLILIHPGASKTQLTSVDFTSWFLGRNPKCSAIGLSYSSSLAEKSGRKVKNRLKHPLHTELFPKSQLSMDSRAGRRFTTISGGEYNAVGFNGTVFGLRADLLTIDDPLKSEKEARSQSSQRWAFTRGIIKSRLKPGGRIVACTTRLCVGDWVSQLMNDEEWIAFDDPNFSKRNPNAWVVLKLAAEKNGRYLWEEHLGKEHYEDAKKDPKSWAALYMQDPTSGYTGPWFADIELPYYEEVIKPGKFPAWMMVDPGLSKSHSADPTSIMVVVTTPEKKILLADWVLDRLDPDERTSHIIRLIKRWEPRRFIYEEFGLVADSFHLKRDLRAAGIHILPIPVGRKGPRHLLSTEDRIRELIIDFKDDRFAFPRKMERKLVNGEIVDLMRYFRDEEFCLEAQTPVLMADLSWRPLGDILVGDEVLSVEEHSQEKSKGGDFDLRRWQVATVTSVRHSDRACVELVTEMGNLVATEDHRVLRHHDRRWCKIGDLRVLRAGRGTSSSLVSVGRPWSTASSYEDGWLAGFLDGEGHIKSGKNGVFRYGRQRTWGAFQDLGFSQKPGPVWERAIKRISELGFVTQMVYLAPSGVLRGTIKGSQSERMKFLGMVRPGRLVDNFQGVVRMGNMRLPRYVPSKITERRGAGMRHVVDINTTARTFIANGFIVHNCLYAGEGSVIHDEGLDTLSRTHDPELALTYPDAPGAERDDEEYTDTTGGGGLGWEAVF